MMVMVVVDMVMAAEIVVVMVATVTAIIRT
jgi:hypothetical protein